MNIGRPRSFDLDAALERALQVFWRLGYESASLSDLTGAMGINPPSLYAAFGSKEGLFRQALDRYMEKRAAFLAEAFAQPTARDVAAFLLEKTADLQTCSTTPRGCLLVQGALTGKNTADNIRQELAQKRADGETALGRRFQQAISDGDLPQDQDPARLARYVMTVVQGMAVKAVGGASAAELMEIVDLALAAFPRANAVSTSKQPAAGGRRKVKT